MPRRTRSHADAEALRRFIGCVIGPPLAPLCLSESDSSPTTNSNERTDKVTQKVTDNDQKLDSQAKQLICAKMHGPCAGPVTHIDSKGFIYCAPHGAQRKAYQRCRKLTSTELKILRNGQPIAAY